MTVTKFLVPLVIILAVILSLKLAGVFEPEAAPPLPPTPAPAEQDAAPEPKLPTVYDHPTWSPDGTKIAFALDRDVNCNWEIFVMNSDGGDQTRLTSNASPDKCPAWSPDGRQIAFGSQRDGNFEIYVMNADGSNQTRLTTNTTDDIFPSWSPDGKKIAFTSRRDGNEEIYVINADGSGPTRLTNNSAEDRFPAWSPR